MAERVNGKLTPWGAFAQHRRDANKRSIPFNFEFDEWCAWWEINLGANWFVLRGCKVGQYVMARLGDKGPYHPTNVKCITSGENHKEGNIGKPKPGNIEHCRRLGLSHKGKPSHNKGVPMSEATKEKLRRPKSLEHRLKLSIAAKKRKKCL